MKNFLDANILISVLNKEYPVFPHAAKILSLSGKSGTTICTSPLCLAIAFYFSEKKSGTSLAKKKMALLINHISICPIDSNIPQKAASNPAIHDFEDGMEYYSAMHYGCNVIVTQDIGDFYFSEIPVYNATDFLNFYIESQRS